MRLTGTMFRRLTALLTVSCLGLAFPAASQEKEKDKEPAKAPAPSGTSGAINDAEVIAFINSQVKTQWDENKITPARLASDHEFLRRVYLDIIGRIPTVYEINNYLKRDGSRRKAEEIQSLLKHEDFAQNWANVWTVWLLTRTSPPGVDREKLKLWLEECFALNKPYNKMVEELLTASGKADENGPANFVLSHMGEQTPAENRSRDGQFEMVPVTSRSTKLFLGIQTQCTQCHNHPFIDGRKQTQYWGINAFFRQAERTPAVIMERRRDQVKRYYSLNDNLSANPSGKIFFEQRNGLLLVTKPTFIDGTRLDISSGDEQINRRKELSKLLVNDPYFAKAIVNRMWHHFMGRGFTQVVDDFGEGDHNPISHPELLDRLARDFAATGFDLRRLMTWITSSLPYSLTSVANATNEKQDAEPYFSRMLLKAMTPEQLVDSIFTATSAERTKSSVEDRRKMYDDWLRDFTVNFGDDEGNEATFNGTVVQALLLMNGTKLNDAIKNKPGSTVAEASTKGNRWVTHIYLSALGRPPTAAEGTLAGRIFASAPKEKTSALQDVLWALINSNEFILNH